MGAWIETCNVNGLNVDENTSHPTWVRGLKQLGKGSVKIKYESHPTWVRGLKHRVAEAMESATPSRILHGCVD